MSGWKKLIKLYLSRPVKYSAGTGGRGSRSRHFPQSFIPGGIIRVNCSRRSSTLFVCLLLLSSSPLVMLAQTTSANETGKFTLHKFEQPIGEETYTIAHEGGSLTLKTDFAFTDRGSRVPLSATLKAADDYTPQSFVIKGNTSRMSDIDSDVELNGSNATIRRGKETSSVAAPQSFFTISGYAPVAVQMALIRYWRAHGSPHNWRRFRQARSGYRIVASKPLRS